VCHKQLRRRAKHSRCSETDKEPECRVITLSGFSANNPLRKQGRINWYSESSEYGFVELLHLVICHAILDLEMGRYAERTLLPHSPKTS
jgi:hypothetical protein